MKWDRKAFVVCVLVVGVCGGLVWMLAARPARAFTLVPHMLLPEHHVLLEVHPNERVRASRTAPFGVGDNDYDQIPGGAVGGWNAYTFHGQRPREQSGHYWIQVCAQTFNAEQNKAAGGAATEDEVRMVVNGKTLEDYWHVQSGPAGGPQWRGDVAKGSREVLEFYYALRPGEAPEVHRIDFRCLGAPIIWWIKVTKLPVEPVRPLTTAPTLRQQAPTGARVE